MFRKAMFVVLAAVLSLHQPLTAQQMYECTTTVTTTVVLVTYTDGSVSLVETTETHVKCRSI